MGSYEDEDEPGFTGSGDEREDEAAKLRKRLGLPEYDPDAALVSSIPKVQHLTCNGYKDSCCKFFVELQGQPSLGPQWASA